MLDRLVRIGGTGGLAALTYAVVGRTLSFRLGQARDANPADGADSLRRIDWSGLGFAAAWSLAVLALFWGRLINHDTGWYLVATRKWVEGAGLYTTLMEVNPPLNFYLTLPAIRTADLFGVSDGNGQFLILALALFVILTWCRAIIRDEIDLAPPRGSLLLVAIAVALVVPALSDFGQREHLLVMLAMPWILGQMAPESAPGGRRAARAAVAAVGICLKPHFVLFPVAATVAEMVSRRSLRPVLSVSNLVFLAAGLGYVAFVALWHPAYFTQMVPIARAIYGAYGSSLATVLFYLRIELLLALLPMLVVLSRPRAYRGAGLFAALALAGLGTYLAQSTGFTYHSIPFRAFAFLAACMIVLRAPRPGAAALVAGVAATALAWHDARRIQYRNLAALEIAEVAQEMGGAHSLMVLTPHVSAGPAAAMASGATWVSRYPANWLVPGAVNRLAATDCRTEARLCAGLEAIADRNRKDNIADIAAAHPDLLVFDRRSGYFDRPDFSWPAFMEKDPGWAPLFGDYMKVRTTERFEYYRYRPAAPGR